MSEKLQPGLYIVATPIGNLSDLSPHAADVLARADLIAVEDSRVTAKLLHHIGVKRPMTPYHDHNADRVRPDLIDQMAEKAVAPAARKTAAKKPAAKKAALPAAKKAVAKKTAAPAARKTVAKPVAKKVVAKKATAKKVSAS